MDKRGAFIWPRSLLWLFLGLVFLYLALMPFFNVFPYNFEVGEDLLRFLIVAMGVLILIESFRKDKGFRRFFWIIVGIIIAAFGIYIFLIGINVSLPFTFTVNKIILQIILALYSVYLIIGAWQQTRVINTNN
jgi:amino acid transporter